MIPLVEADVLTVARPQRASEILDQIDRECLPRCQRPISYLNALKHRVRGSVEMSRGNHLAALAHFDAQLTISQEPHVYNIVADVARGFAIHLAGAGTYEPRAFPPSPYSFYQHIARNLVEAPADPELARQRLIRLASEVCDGRIPLQEAAFLTVLARCAWLAGDNDHALELLHVVTPRIPPEGRLAIDTLAQIEHWPSAEYAQRTYNYFADPDRHHRALTQAPAALAKESASTPPADSSPSSR